MADLEKRFQLIDLDDPVTYPQLSFGPWRDGGTFYGRANPTRYTPYKREEAMKSSVSVDGYRVSYRFPLQPEAKRLEWDIIGSDFHTELKKRCDSGHTFLLVDHNGRILTGKIKEFEFEEKGYYVPSYYTGGFTFEGIGYWKNPLV